MPPSRPKDPRQNPWTPSPIAGRGKSPGSPPPRATQASRGDQYGAFRASLLYCANCKQATPTRERLLLVLPTGNLYEYLCTQCGASTGSKTDRDQGDAQVIIP